MDTTMRMSRTLPGVGLVSVVLCLLMPGCGEPVGPPAPELGDWCEHIAPGPGGTASAAVALSAAHEHVRYFGMGSSYAEADLALAAALEGTAVDWDEATRAYAAALEGVCVLEATAQPLPAARVEQVGAVAVIHPGTGELALPPGSRAVFIDLRELPSAPGLEQALAQALAVASQQPVPRSGLRVHSYWGKPDELADSGIYTNRLQLQKPSPYAAGGSKDLPMALLTGPRLAPEAARFAVDVRTARRAWLFGEAVSTAVAESRWVPVRGQGLVVRTGQLEDNAGILPDGIAADLPLRGSLESAVRELPELGTPPVVNRSVPARRPAPRARAVSGEPDLPQGSSPGVARADLLITHGTMRRFFPYFPVVGDGIDERLNETIAAVDEAPVDTRRVVQLLQRFGEVLRDGHGFVSTLEPSSAGIFPALLEDVAGEAVIRRSLLPGAEPGDTLVSVGGRPMSEWLAEELTRTSAATPGNQRLSAIRRLLVLQGPTAFGLRAPDGSERTVEVVPQPSAEVYEELGTVPSMRGAGRLNDLGAPSLHYINLSGDVLTREDTFLHALQQARDASGLILDMRGYPGISHYMVAQHLIRKRFRSPLFRIPSWEGPDVFSMGEEQYWFSALGDVSFDGPIVLLVGPGTISAAENFSSMLVGADRVRVVGRRSAGTNGNISRIRLPGRISFMFTGMEVLFPDGTSRFHGVGIVPDHEVSPTVEDLRTGRDPELLRAIELLQ